MEKKNLQEIILGEKMELKNYLEWAVIIAVFLIFIYIGMYLESNKTVELPKDNIYQKLAPLYTVCYRYQGDVICCAKPVINVSYEKEILICDRLKEVNLEDRFLIIRE